MRQILCTSLSALAVTIVTCAGEAGTVANLMRVVPAPAKVTIDGLADDWDLREGMLICGDVDNQINTCSLWVHAMYDANNLYLLVRWRDETPLNNPKPFEDNQGWQGDSLQFRLWEKKGQTEKVVHMDAWQAPDGKDRVSLVYGRNLNEAAVRHAQKEGAQQTFRLAGQHVYLQEIAVPWKLLTLDGKQPTAASTLKATWQGNFTQPSGKELPIGDLFRRGQKWNLNGVFQHPDWWGDFVLVDAVNEKPQPVTLTDGQVYQVDNGAGYPIVDWRGRVEELPALGVLRISDVPEEIRTAVEASLESLRMGNSVQRRDAMKSLRGLGPKAFPVLHQNLDDPDPEVSFSIREILYGR